MDDSLAPTGRGPAKQGSGRRTTALPNSRISLSNEPSDINVASDAPRGSKKRKPAKPISLKLRYEKEFLAPEAVQRIADKASTHVPSPESSDQQVSYVLVGAGRASSSELFPIPLQFLIETVPNLKIPIINLRPLLRRTEKSFFPLNVHTFFLGGLFW